MRKVILVVVAFLAFVVLNAQGESKIKALFVYNFTRLVEWPANGDNEFVIGVLGTSSVSDELQILVNGKSVGAKKIVVRQFKNIDQVGKCNILYVSSMESGKIGQLQNMVTIQNTLIIGEKKGLIEQGAAINFYLNGDKLAFNVSVENAQKYGLKVSKSLIDMSKQS